MAGCTGVKEKESDVHGRAQGGVLQSLQHELQQLQVLICLYCCTSHAAIMHRPTEIQEQRRKVKVAAQF